MNEEMIVEAMKASISNFQHYTQKHKAKRGVVYIIKYYLWLIIVTVLSPRHQMKSKCMVCAITPLNKKQLLSFAENDEVICFSQLNSKIMDIRNNLSVFSPYKRRDRVAMLMRGAKFYFRHLSELCGYMYFVMEYYVIASYLYDFKPEKIISPNTYERYCTLLSYLGHGIGIRLIGIQEGMLINMYAPAKVYCDEMHTFDQFEADIFREIILNDDCKYVYDGFKSTLKWAEHAFDGKKVIGIASQDWLTEKTIATVSELMLKIDRTKYKIIIYPHYREKSTQYAELQRRFPECEVETNVRHRNIDLLITFYSTIVFDFWSVNPQLPVVCIQIPGFEPTYYQRTLVTVCSSPKEVAEQIVEILSGS